MNIASYRLPIEDTLRTSWQKVHGSKSTFWIALIILIAICVGVGIIEAILDSTMPQVAPFISILFQIFTYLISVGLIFMGIRRARDISISYDQLFHAFKNNLWIKVIGVYILEVLILFIPILIMVGGSLSYPMLQTSMGQTSAALIAAAIFTVGFIALVYLSIRIVLSMGYVMDRETGPVDSIKLSFQATRGNFWNVLFIIIIQSLIVVISMIPLGIGLIWTIPFSLINYGMMYDRLSTNNAGNAGAVKTNNPRV